MRVKVVILAERRGFFACLNSIVAIAIVYNTIFCIFKNCFYSIIALIYTNIIVDSDIFLFKICIYIDFIFFIIIMLNR